MKKTANAMVTGLAALGLLAGAARADPPVASEQPKVGIELGYNALQLGVTDDADFRPRTYTSITANIHGVTIGATGMNEGGNNYVYGQNALLLGHKKSPVSGMYTWRHEGEQSTATRDAGVGLRVDIAALPSVDYGRFDVWKNLGVGTTNYDGIEATVLAGWELPKGMAIEALLQAGEGNRRYGELELLGPLWRDHWRLYGRAEFVDLSETTAIVGIQVQK